MKRRFFFILFGFLTATILIVSVSQQFYFASERARLIDQRLETIATSLLASGLSLDFIKNLESTDDLVSDLLGEERVDMLINIYSLDGKLLAQNYTASEIPLEYDRQTRWGTYHVEGRNVRVLNLESHNLVVQVGLFLNPSLNHWATLFNERFALFLLLISLLLVATAYLGSRILFNPLRRLTVELANMSEQLDRKMGQALTEFVIGPQLSRLASKGDRSDDFQLLCAEISSFVGKLGDYTKSFHAQAAILTHELKTPLTILRSMIDEITRARDVAQAREFAATALIELDSMAAMINGYLQWSVLASNPARPAEIYAVKLTEMLKKVTGDLNQLHSQRIDTEFEGDVTLFAMHSHVQQLLSNLLLNALNYSPPTSHVQCQLRGNTLTIIDHGSGIPANVRQALGQPFNRGDGPSSARGSGLGLAWVHLLCAKYGWKLSIDSAADSGTIVRVQF